MTIYKHEGSESLVFLKCAGGLDFLESNIVVPENTCELDSGKCNVGG